MNQQKEPPEEENIYDAHLMDVYSVGDFVSWKVLGAENKRYGYIQEIYVQEKANNRNFIFAKVLNTAGKSESFMLSYLKLESK